MDDYLNMLPIARYRYRFVARTPVQFPDWSGSALRGAFGHALRRLACMTRAKQCTGCPLLETCPYPAVFAPPPTGDTLHRLTQAPAPYVIEPESWGARRIEPGEFWYFDLVLLGRALRELPLVTYAWRQAARYGLGPGDGQSDLECVELLLPDGSSQPVLTAAEGRILEHQPPIPDHSPTECRRLTVRLTSPLRLQDNGRAVPPDRLTPDRLLMAAVRRASLNRRCHGDGAPDWDFAELAHLARNVKGTKALTWRDWTRRSARQQQVMTLGGVIGLWQIEGELTPFTPALKIGQWLHIGKETVFGLGRYHLTDICADSAGGRDYSRQGTDLEPKTHVPQCSNPALISTGLRTVFGG
ncbi:MAG TPA: hypothetical protein DIT03_02135, partial [Candidatus Accumulibacter sp.]|nr:hypothetical protein [Accumulibacter sp.]